MRKSKFALIVLSSAFLVDCGSIDFGEAFLDTALVAAEASEIRECRTMYRMTGDALQLEACETDALR